MPDRSFVHLHCHSHYSLLDGANRIPELIAHTKANGMNAIALTDHGNLYGAIEFYRESKDAGINPIIGYEAYVSPGHRTERLAGGKRGDAAYHLTLLAQNATGFRNLVKMASIAFLEGYHYVPRIDKELLEAHKEGLICLSGCASSEFSEFILKDQLAEAQKVAEWFAKLFGPNFYVEIQDNGLDIQRECREGAVTIANRLGLPLVATSDAHYLTSADAPAHDVLLCINTRAKRSDVKRMRYGSEQFYVRPPAEMYKLFPGHADAVQRSQEIADSVHIELDFKKRHFPVFTPPAGQTPEEHLRELCQIGLKERFGDHVSQAAHDRLEHELNIICRMGFASYFLIVGDFVRFAVENGIPCSARGSACGSLVSYVLKLSHVDPLEYDLLFERFLDPNRSEAPDIDIDFCQERREEVIAYVRRKYGEASVAQIGTFGTMAARAALRDVGRVLDLPLFKVDELVKMIPTTLGITLEEALQQNSELKNRYAMEPDVRELIDIARRLEGTNRNAGTHAAGVVIANGPLTDFVPLQRVRRRDEEGSGSRATEAVVTTQWVMGDIEKVGLLKMDFLGLRTLTLLDNAAKLIEKTRGEKIDIYKLPLDDPETYALLQRGDAKGVFQFESDGIRDLLKRLRPDNIRDIIACTALYRPGPLGGGMVDDYINCKHGLKKPVYVHPVMEEILGETHGVMSYQEQIMRILNRLGGIELSSAYACIKAISKKKHDIIDQRRVDFIRGAQERGVDQRTAEEIFGLIVFFGGYGFNKCLIGSTTIIDAQTGERTTIEALFRERRPFVVHALGEDGRLRPRRVEDVVWNGKKPVFEVRTAQGKRITATANHPFRTLDGWTMLEQLRPGDRIAAPRSLEVASEESWPEHELITLAGLLAEGNTCHPTCLYFFGNDPVLVNDFAAAASRFTESVARVYSRGDERMEVCVSTGRDARFKKGVRSGRKDEAVGQTLPARSGAFRWAEQLGIFGRKATEKRVPEGIFRLRNTDVELFLGRLWAGDGFIANHALFVPFYATSSYQLAVDVQTLLLRLGIISGIHEKQFKYRGGLRPGYTVHLLGEGSVQTFLERVCPHAVGREAQVGQLRAYLATVPPGLGFKDTVPPEVRVWVDEERRRAGLTWVALESQSDLSMKMFIGKATPEKKGFRRGTLAKLAEFFGSERLANIAASDLFWDRIVSIEPKGVQDTYDLTVEVDHNFVADGLIVHNSHSAAYAYVSYQTAYLKTHYTPEFMAALLSSEIEDGNKRDILVQHIDDCRKLHVEVLPPSVNSSDTMFGVRDGKITFGLMAVKGAGRGACDEIVRARAEGGSFKDMYDFCERIDLKIVNKSAVEKLIMAGALDCLQAHRAQLMHLLPRAIQAANERQNDRRLGQRSLFEGDVGSAAVGAAGADDLPAVPPWSDAEKLKHEKDVLDFYITSHPLAQFDKELRRFRSYSVEELKGLPAEQEVTLGGMLTQVRFMNTKKARNGNSRYVRCKVEDFTGTVECVMWPDDFVRYKDEVAEDRICFVKGTVERNREEPGLVLNRVFSIEQAQRELARTLYLKVVAGRHDHNTIDTIGYLLKQTPGPCPVTLVVYDPTGKKATVKLAREFAINPRTFLCEELENLLGADGVKLG